MWTKFRLRAVWVMVPLYLVFAQPTASVLLIGLPFVLFGVLIRGWAASAIRKNRVLTTHGPYAFTRNPLYLGSFLIGIGFGVASGVLWILALFLVFFGVVYGLTVRKEERRLAERFGEAFDRYVRAVPRFLPRVTAWSPSVEPATESVWRRYWSSREYEALLGVGVMYLALLIKLLL
jgi:protein-S-isoprenylcysteine O-methyltransferase Ste14